MKAAIVTLAQGALVRYRLALFYYCVQYLNNAVQCPNDLTLSCHWEIESIQLKET